MFHRQVSSISVCTNLPESVAIPAMAGFTFLIEFESEVIFLHSESESIAQAWVEALRFEPSITNSRTLLPTPLLKFFALNDILTSKEPPNTNLSSG